MSSSESEDTPFVRASLLRNRLLDGQPPIRATHTCVEYADGTSALAIYPVGEGDEEETNVWVSALGESFVDLQEVR